MEKQMRAEREKREAILLAEGEKESNVLVAKGEKEAAILRAEAKKAALIAEAEGAATAIEMINKAKPSQAYLTLQGYEALAKVADGQSTKLIIPSEIQNIAGILASSAEIVKDDQPKSRSKNTNE
jgi:regulator of protease activity HflC (stomatin/prohibitin superfamily)